VEIRHHVTRHLGRISLRMHRNSYLGAFSKKSYPAIRSGYLDFLFTIYSSRYGAHAPKNVNSVPGLKTSDTINFSGYGFQ